MTPRQGIQGSSILHGAVMSGDLAVVHLIVSAGAVLDLLDRDQMTPLMLATSLHHNHIVSYLINAGADLPFKVIRVIN